MANARTDSTSGEAGSKSAARTTSRRKAWLVRSIMAALAIAYVWHMIAVNIRYAGNDYIIHLQEIVDRRTAHLRATNDLDVVIVGGSNSLFGVSAKQISRQTGLSAYNISLMHEGHYDKNYFNFMEESIPRAVRAKVKFVVLSTIAPFGDLALERRRQDENLTHDLVGRQLHVTLTPNEPLLYAIAVVAPQLLRPSRKGTDAEGKLSVDEAYGDLNFKMITCRYDSERHILNRASDVFDVILPRLQGIRTIFPYATVIVSIPPLASDTGGITEQFVRELSALLPENMLVSVTPALDRKYFCDSEIHPNAQGRMIRTNGIVSDILRAR
ncbi:hypothetical protein [Blastochloris sulfoviridis]|uniref:SGNH/GDSL hydrolase family protein n=1 Tax=Blastochloris sulfoviridis TaxID=50712 RepID=A0A5M6I499_9HYPH|nr:hypothetical protein [Blastochloris sulfoviridis]KAA5602687.1 hypothetical protein F1193_04175 [Blastochloris sulfoviridis]